MNTFTNIDIGKPPGTRGHIPIDPDILHKIGICSENRKLA
jgi:hypothetical protein